MPHLAVHLGLVVVPDLAAPADERARRRMTDGQPFVAVAGVVARLQLERGHLGAQLRVPRAEPDREHAGHARHVPVGEQLDVLALGGAAGHQRDSASLQVGEERGRARRLAQVRQLGRLRAHQRAPVVAQLDLDDHPAALDADPGDVWRRRRHTPRPVRAVERLRVQERQRAQLHRLQRDHTVDRVQAHVADAVGGPGGRRRVPPADDRQVVHQRLPRDPPRQLHRLRRGVDGGVARVRPQLDGAERVVDLPDDPVLHQERRQRQLDGVDLVHAAVRRQRRPVVVRERVVTRVHDAHGHAVPVLHRQHVGRVDRHADVVELDDLVPLQLDVAGGPQRVLERVRRPALLQDAARRRRPVPVRLDEQRGGQRVQRRLRDRGDLAGLADGPLDARLVHDLAGGAGDRVELDLQVLARLAVGQDRLPGPGGAGRLLAPQRQVRVQVGFVGRVRQRVASEHLLPRDALGLFVLQGLLLRPERALGRRVILHLLRNALDIGGTLHDKARLPGGLGLGGEARLLDLPQTLLLLQAEALLFQALLLGGRLRLLRGQLRLLAAALPVLLRRHGT